VSKMGETSEEQDERSVMLRWPGPGALTAVGSVVGAAVGSSVGWSVGVAVGY
jgi:hypothetical protein